jgi:hypothetical protein
MQLRPVFLLDRLSWMKRGFTDFERVTRLVPLPYWDPEDGQAEFCGGLQAK